MAPHRLASTLAVDCRCTLGEGIVWSPGRRALFWTDIQASTVWMCSPESNVSKAWRLPDRLGSFVLCESGKLLLGLAKGLFLADVGAAASDSLAVTSVVAVEPAFPHLRINDGRTDRAGNYVFGTMNEAVHTGAAGGFYQFSSRHGLRRLNLDPVAIANSICFSLDGRTMYFCDSPARCIMRGDYDAASARVTRVREFVRFGPAQGEPDGSIVDAEGCVWNAAWGVGLIRRYTPDGEVDSEVAVAARNPTCVVFGGDALDRVYITSSRQEMTEEELERTPQAGGIYTLTPGVRGVLDVPFAGM